MDPVTATIAAKGMARLADFAFTAALAGLERQPFVELVGKMEAEGKTPDQITDELEAQRQAAQKSTQGKIDRM